MLVDGAVMKNFPADVMRAIQLGPIVGVDVSRGRSIEADDVAPPPSVWRWLLVRRLAARPADRLAADPLGDGLGRPRSWSPAREATDVLVLPDVDEIEIRDWKAFDRARGGRLPRDASQALDELTRPVVDLRRRASLEEAALGRARGAAVCDADDSSVRPPIDAAPQQ